MTQLGSTLKKGSEPVSLGTWRYLRRYIRPWRMAIAGGLGASVLQAATQWATPWPIKIIFDNVLGHRPLPAFLSFLPSTANALLIVLTLSALAVAALQAVFSYISNRLVAHAGQGMAFAMRNDLFDNLARQSLDYHQSQRVGDLTSRLGADIQAIQQAMVNVMPTLLNNVATLSGIVVILGFVSPMAALIALAAVPLQLFVVRHYLGRIRSAQRRVRDYEGDLSASAQEVLTSLPVIQAFGQEKRESQRYAALNDKALSASKDAVVLQAEFTPIMAAITAALATLVTFFGAEMVLSGSLTPGDLLVFAAYLRAMYTPIRQLAKLAGTLGKSEAAAERVIECLRANEQVVSPKSPKRMAERASGVVFDSVFHHYPGGATSLKGVDLEAKAGERLALIGATGSGKSTLIKLIPRFFDPHRGRVLIDGVDVKELSLAELRSSIALVPQEPYLFAGPIWQNILYGAQNNSKATAIEAAKAAGVHEVISALHQGYDTWVAERGTSLSGGQKQCVAISRAMARSAKILLLDEPTAGLDAETEALLLEAIDRVSDGRTTLFVTHQLQGAIHADSIALMSDGRVQEYGDHHSLSASASAYRRLSQIQSGLAGLEELDRSGDFLKN